jgi:hypothetical protein
VLAIERRSELAAQILRPGRVQKRGQDVSAPVVAQLQPRPGHLASQHRDLVAHHEQLNVLGGRAPRQQHKPTQHLAEQQVQQSSCHAAIIVAHASPTNSHLSTHDRLSGAGPDPL